MKIRDRLIMKRRRKKGKKKTVVCINLKQNYTKSYCTPPPSLLKGRGGGGMNLLPNFQEGSFTGPQLLEGVGEKEGVTFVRGMVAIFI